MCTPTIHLPLPNPLSQYIFYGNIQIIFWVAYDGDAADAEARSGITNNNYKKGSFVFSENECVFLPEIKRENEQVN